MTVSTILYDRPGSRNPFSSKQPSLSFKREPHRTVAHLMNLNQPGLTTYRSIGYAMEDGSYRVVGANNYGSNGFGHNAYASWYPSTVWIGQEEKEEVVNICHGYAQTHLLSSSGQVWGWGYNGHGQVGDKSTTDRLYPVPLNFPSPVIKLINSDNGSGHVYTSLAALCRDGTVWAWGYNGYGQLGQGNTTNCLQPTLMKTSADHILKDVVDIEAHGGKFCSFYCVKRDGTVWAVGYNHYGQLGVGDTVNRNYLTPCVLPQTQHWIKAVGTGNGSDQTGSYGTTLFLSSSGMVYGCGYNGYSQVGNGLTATSPTPQKVLSLGGVQEPLIAHVWCFGGQYASCYASDRKGHLWVWGYNGYGQLGLNSTQNANPTRADIEGQAPFITAIGYGGSNSYGTVAALSKEGRVWTTGYNGHGQTGQAHASNQYIWQRPFLPPKVTIKEVQGFGHNNEIGMSFLTTKGEVYTCGYNGEGMLGINAMAANTSIPQPVIF